MSSTQYCTILLLLLFTISPNHQPPLVQTQEQAEPPEIQINGDINVSSSQATSVRAKLKQQSTGQQKAEDDHQLAAITEAATASSVNLVVDDSDPTSYFESNSLDTKFNQRATFDDYITFSMRALKLIAGYDNDLHRYDLKQDLIGSFARNLSYTDDLSGLKARVDPTETELLEDQSELTLIENELNQVNCGRHLDLLIQESCKLFKNFDSFSRSNQLNLIDFLDSFGSPSSQLMKGNSMWLGSHEQCFNSKLTILQQLTNEPAPGTRYCVGNFRSPDWARKQAPTGSESIKLGICLPNTCNSLSILRHKELIETLVKIVRFNQVPYKHYKLSNLYCLPDESSPLRQFSLSARLFILILSSWLTMVVYFSLKYEYYRMKWSHKDNIQNKKFQDSSIGHSKSMKIFALRLSWAKLFEDNIDESRCSALSPSLTTLATVIPVNPGKLVFEAGSRVVNDVQVLAFPDSSSGEHESGIDSSDSEQSSESSVVVGGSLKPMKTANILEALKQSSTNYSSVNQIISGGKTVESKSTVLNRGIKPHNTAVGKSTVCVLLNQPPVGSVDLSAIDGIKVISMIWLVSAHTLLFFIRTIANGRDFWSMLRDAKFMTIMAGIFPVDSFFTITGILTAYLKFKKNDGQAMGKASYWIEAFVHRYLRFMPMYLIVFWYTRDVSQYIGLGPLWDYATADTSLRSVCKQESVTVPLFFQANFKPIDQHCVKPAWYLANDYQYLLITPIFMGLIMRSTLLGYSVIALSIFASLVLQFLTVFYSTDLDDFGALINFKPMFGTYVLKNLWKLYVLPYNRIPPYLIGIVTGHLMYSLNKFPSKQNPQTSLTKDDDAQSFRKSLDSIASSIPAYHESTRDILKNPTDVGKHKIIKPNNSYGYFGALKSYICVKVWTPLVFLISIIYLPMLTKISTQEGLLAKLGTSSIMALMRFVWSLAIARLIYICATRFLEDNNNSTRSDSFIIRFLSSPKWKPWSKIGLSALLIQWEIISYLAQTQTSAPNITITFLLAIILVCIVATYSLALLIYLTLEYPLSQIEQLYIHPLFFNKR